MDRISIKIKGVSETLFLTLYSRAIESLSDNPIIIDNNSVEIVKNLDNIFSKYENKFYKMLISRKIPKDYTTLIAIRTKKFDDYVKDFLNKNPEGIIIEIGCGLSTRFHRLDNKKLEWYDLDLPPVINLKKCFLQENNRYHFISSSALDYKWMEKVSKNNRPILFLAEGVFQYLKEEQVKDLIFNLQKNFSGCDLVCGVVNSYYVKKQNNRLLKGHTKSSLNIDNDVNINFGISKSDEFSSWNNGIKFLDDCSFYDANIKKIRLFKFLEKIRKTEWIVHYKLV